MTEVNRRIVVIKYIVIPNKNSEESRVYFCIYVEYFLCFSFYSISRNPAAFFVCYECQQGAATALNQSTRQRDGKGARSTEKKTLKKVQSEKKTLPQYSFTCSWLRWYKFLISRHNSNFKINTKYIHNI